MICLYEDQCSRCRGAVILLGGDLAGEVDLMGRRIPHALKQRLGVVRPFHDRCFDHLATDRRMPAVIAERAQERLVDSSADKLRRELVVVQHIANRIGLFFDPEHVSLFDVVSHLVGLRLACVCDDSVILRRRDGSDALAEDTSEEVVP